MQVTNRYQVEGLAELEKALLELGAEMGLKTLRTAGRKAMQPVLDAAIAGANEDTGQLKQSLAISTSQGRGARGRGGSNAVNINVSASKRSVTTKNSDGSKTKTKLRNMNAVAGAQEYGTSDQQAEPFLRPALSNNANRVLSLFRSELSIAIEKAAKKLARQAAK